MTIQAQTAAFTITYDPKNIHSLSNGLKDYRQFIQQKQAFSDFHCHVRFKLADNTDDSLAELLHDPILKTLLSFSDVSLTELAQNHKLADCYIEPETAFFLRALTHPELEDELKQTAVVLSQVSRRINDSAEMWISDTEVLGLSALFALALKYPKYTYLLAAYIVPYWDTEHAPFGEEVLALVASHHGYSHDMLKAFCYCDNDSARAKMFALQHTTYDEHQAAVGDAKPQSLLDIFRQQPQEFEVFKKLLKQRFSEQDYLQYVDDERYYNEDPIRSFVTSLVATDDGSGCYDTDEQSLTMSEAWFIDSSADDAAADLKLEVETYLGRSIVVPKTIEEDDDLTEHYYRGTGISQWKAFITGALNHGTEIWDFIVNGDNEQILEQVEACDIEGLIRAGNYQLIGKVNYFVGNFDSFDSELEKIIYDVLADWTFDDDGEANESEGRFKLFRLLDVLYRCNGTKGFDPNFIEHMVTEYEFFSHSEFMARYPGDWRIMFSHAMDSFSGYRSNIERNEAESLYALTQQHRSEVAEFIAKMASDEDCEQITLLGLCAIIAFFDQQHAMSDDLTQKVLQILNDQLVAAIYQQTAETSLFQCAKKRRYRNDYSKLDEAEISQINQDWQVVEQYLKGDAQDFELALTAFEKHQVRCDEEDALFRALPHYEFLRDFDDKAQKLLVCAQIIAQFSQSSIQLFAQRYVALWLHIAPTKTLKMLAYFHVKPRYGHESYSDFDKRHHQKIAFIEQLEGVTAVGESAYLLENLIGEMPSDTDMQVVFELWFKQFQEELSLPEEQRSLHHALTFILPRYQQIFMTELKQFNSALIPNYFEQILLDLVINRVTQRIQNTIHDKREFNQQERHDVEVVRQYLLLDTPASLAQIDAVVSMMEKRYIDDFNSPYGGVELDKLFWHLSSVQQDNLMQIYIYHSDMSFDVLCQWRNEEQQYWLCERALGLGMNTLKLLRLILKEQWHNCLVLLPNQDVLAEQAQTLDIETLYQILINVAKLGNFEHFITTFKDHASRRIRDLVADIHNGKYAQLHSSLLEVINYGIYTEVGTVEDGGLAELDDDTDDEFVTVTQLEHQKETLLVEAEVGVMIGMRVGYFSDDEEQALPEVLAFKVRVHHPYIRSHDGYVSQWDSEVTLDYSCYVGWTFSHKSLCVAGIYKIELLDLNDNVIESKTFHVVSKRPLLVDALVEQYQSSDLVQHQVGCLNLSDKALAIVDAKKHCDTLNIAHQLENNLINVYSYFDDKQLAFSELRLNDCSVQHWYIASNQLRMFIEKRVKGKKLLLGTAAATKFALDNKQQWHKVVNRKSPVSLFQPQESKADNVLALHLDKGGFRTLVGYSADGKPCCIVLAHMKIGLFRRLLLRMVAKVAQNAISDKGLPSTL